MQYVSPKRLKKGDKVAIIAPAEAWISDELEEGLDIIREAGLVPVLGKNAKKMNVDPPFSAPLEDRIKEINWAFSDPSVSGVIPVVGGFGCAELLSHLDYKLIRKRRLAFLGMSDVSALNNGILHGAGLITINGQSPSIRVDQGSKLRKTDSESLKFALELMMSDEPWESRPLEINDQTARTVTGGKATGHIIGCNLETFESLIGTEHMPEALGAILFIEDVRKDTIGLARMMLHLKMCGILDSVAGIVVGEFAEENKSDKKTDPTIDEVIDMYLKPIGVPCVYGYSFSHGPYTMPIPVGATVTIDADSGELVFDFSMD